MRDLQQCLSIFVFIRPVYKAWSTPVSSLIVYLLSAAVNGAVACKKPFSPLKPTLSFDHPLPIQFRSLPKIELFISLFVFSLVLLSLSANL
jgi:hypothetical protein